MIRYETRNSVYEIDEENKQIRRLRGVAEPTRRIGIDGEWRSYQAYVESPVGLVIVWPWVNENGSIPTTITSEVTKVTWDSKEGT